jgi:hypothetical protein
MPTRYVKQTKKPTVTFAPGDQVIRYVDGQPFFCTVVQIEQDERVRVSCNLWPSGYSALVVHTMWPLYLAVDWQPISSLHSCIQVIRWS